MKKTLLNGLVVLSTISCMVAPMVIYSQSKDISKITMKHCMVDGKDNGRTYTLENGSASFDGEIKAVAKDARLKEPKCRVGLVLRDDWGRFKGSFEVNPKSLDKWEDFSGDFGDIKEGSGYYLELYRGNDDGTTIYVDGSIEID